MTSPALEQKERRHSQLVHKDIPRLQDEGSDNLGMVLDASRRLHGDIRKGRIQQHPPGLRRWLYSMFT